MADNASRRQSQRPVRVAKLTVKFVSGATVIVERPANWPAGVVKKFFAQDYVGLVQNECVRKGNENEFSPLELTAKLSVFAALLFVTFNVGAQPREARGRLYTKADVDRIIKRVDTSSDKFKKEFDRALDEAA